MKDSILNKISGFTAKLTQLKWTICWITICILSGIFDK